MLRRIELAPWLRREGEQVLGCYSLRPERGDISSRGSQAGVCREGVAEKPFVVAGREIGE